MVKANAAGAQRSAGAVSVNGLLYKDLRGGAAMDARRVIYMTLLETGEHRTSVVSRVVALTLALTSMHFGTSAASQPHIIIEVANVGTGRVDDELARGRAYQHVHVLHRHGAEQHTIRSRCRTADTSSRHRMAGVGGRQPSATSNAVTLRVSRLNSTPIRWIGSRRPRYFAA